MGTSSVSMALKSSEVHQHEELQGVGVHLQRVLTFELLPAMVNKSKNAAGQLLVMEHNDAGSLGWFFND